jgi:predicted membrane GTPase involved in stress response
MNDHNLQFYNIYKNNSRGTISYDFENNDLHLTRILDSIMNSIYNNNQSINAPLIVLEENENEKEKGKLPKKKTCWNYFFS